MSTSESIYKVTKISTLEGHTDRVWHCAWSPGGTALATCGSDKVIRIWKKANPIAPKNYSLVSDHLDTAATILAEIVNDPNVEDIQRNSLVETQYQTSHPEGNPISLNDWVCIQELTGFHERTIRYVSWSPSGRHLAAASFDHSISIWELIDGQFQCVTVLRGHENEVKCVNWADNGELLVSCSRDKTIWVWRNDNNDNDWECHSVLTGHNGDIKRVYFHPLCDDIYSTSYDDTVRVWSSEDDDWYNSTTLGQATSTVWDLSFDKSGRYLATVSDDKYLRIYNYNKDIIHKSWNILLSIQISFYTLYSIDISPQYIPPQYIYDIPSNVPVNVSYVIYNINNRYYLGLSPLSGLIAIGSGDNSIKIYELLRQFPSHITEELLLEYKERTGIQYSIVKVALPPPSSTEQEQGQQGTQSTVLPLFTPVSSKSSSSDDNNTAIDTTTTTTSNITISDIYHPLNHTIDGILCVSTIYNAHLSDVNSITFNPKIGNVLASVGDDNMINLWRITRDFE